MSLIVEDGTGLATAESYLSVADADTYQANHGAPTAWTSLTPSTSAKEQALRLATQYLDIVYGHLWKGRRAHVPQVLAWPRWEVYDFDDIYVSGLSVPQPVKDACAEMALRSLTDDLIPDLVTPGELKSELVKVGSIEVASTYAGSQSQIKRYRKVDLILRDMIESSNFLPRS